MKKKLAILLVLPLLLCSLPMHITNAEYVKLSMNFFGTFDTIITIMGYAEDEAVFNRVAEGAKEQFTRYHQVFDTYSAHEGVNNLYVLNREGANGPVKVEPELIDLLLFCREYQPITLGSVNVAMGAVLDLWHLFREDGEMDPLHAELPPMERLEAAAQHINFDDVIIDEEAGTVAFADPALRLDVGAVAKGYATEQVAQWMLTSEMPSFLVSAGGNMRAGNPPMDGRQRWSIGVQHPDQPVLSSPSEGLMDTVFLANASVVTSGDYQRYYVVDGVRYHHLISPDTLMPADHFRSVSVVCEDSGLADLLSTAFFLLPYEEGRTLADSLDGVDVIWMLNDAENTILMTEGMEAMTKSNGASSVDP